MNSEYLNINVSVAGRSYSFTVSKDEETVVRNAAKQINDEIAKFQRSYKMKDQQDYIAMASLMNTIEMLKKTSQNTNISTSLEAKLQQLDIELQHIEQEVL